MQDTNTFIAHPLTSKFSLLWHKKPKFIASHYTCAEREVSNLLRLAKADMLVLFPIRESTSLIISAAKMAIHRKCSEKAQEFNLTVTKDECIVTPEFIVEKILLPKDRELKHTHLDCLNFDDLRISLVIARSPVCFGNMDAVNTVVKGVVESEGHEFKTANVASTKKKLVVQMGNDTTLDFDSFMEINWPKISAGMDFVVSEEHRWLENLVAEHPDSFFCNHDSLDF